MKDTEISVAGKVVGEYDMCPDDNRPDWEQNDPTKANYIHNRPGYKKKLDKVSSYEEIDVISAKSGDIFRMDKDINSYGGHFLYIANIISGLAKGAPTTTSRIKQVFYNTEIEREYTAYWNLDYSCPVEDLGSGASNSTIKQNRVCTIQYDGSVLFRVYLVTDTDYLQDKYKSKFTKKGVYLEFVKMPRAVAKYCRLSFEVYYYYQIDRNYLPLPSPVFMIPNVTTADAGKVLMIGSDGKPAWTTLPTSTSETT